MKNRYRFARFKAPLHIVAANDNYTRDNGPQGPCPLSKLPDDKLADLEDNFTRSGLTEGKHYALKDVRRERLRRTTKGLNGAEVVSHILALAANAPDYLLTYGDLHTSLWPNEKFIGYGSVQKIKKALGAAILHTVENGLPCVTTLVVHANTRSLSPRAASNIHETLKGLGVWVGDSVDDYILEQTLSAMDVVKVSSMASAA